MISAEWWTLLPSGLLRIVRSVAFLSDVKWLQLKHGLQNDHRVQRGGMCIPLTAWHAGIEIETQRC